MANALVVNPVSSPFQVVRAECVFLTSTALWRLLSEDSCLSSAIFWLEIQTNRSLWHLVFIATKVWADDPNMVLNIDFRKRVSCYSLVSSSDVNWMSFVPTRFRLNIRRSSTAQFCWNSSRGEKSLSDHHAVQSGLKVASLGIPRTQTGFGLRCFQGCFLRVENVL